MGGYGKGDDSMATTELSKPTVGNSEPFQGKYVRAQDILAIKNPNLGIVPSISFMDDGVATVTISIRHPGGSEEFIRHVLTEDAFAACVRLYRAEVIRDHPNAAFFRVVLGGTKSFDGKVTGEVRLKTQLGEIRSIISTSAEDDPNGLRALTTAFAQGYEAGIAMM